jgi:hypothetical protein
MQTANQTSSNTSNKTSHKASNKSSDQSSDQASNKSSNKSSDQASNKSSDQGFSKASKKSSKYSSNKSPGQTILTVDCGSASSDSSYEDSGRSDVSIRVDRSDDGSRESSDVEMHGIVPEAVFNQNFTYEKLCDSSCLPRSKQAERRARLKANGSTRKRSVDKSKVPAAVRAEQNKEEGMTVSAGKLFCNPCSTTVKRSASAISQHLKTDKHVKNKAKSKVDAEHRAYAKTVVDYFPSGGNLAEATVLHRVAVCRALLLLHTGKEFTRCCVYAAQFMRCI